MDDNFPQLLDVPTVAERLSISVWSVFQLIRKGDLKSVKLGKRRLILESDLRDYIARLEEEATP